MLLLRSIKRCLVILAVLAVCYAVIYAKPVLLPLLMAILITLILGPIHRALCKLKLPEPLAAAIVMFVVLAGMGIGLATLATPAIEWGTTLDLKYAEKQVREVFLPMKEVQEGLEDVAEKVDSIAKGGDEEEPPRTIEVEEEKRDKPVEVEIRERPTTGIIAMVQSFGTHAVATLILVFFLLAYGSLIYSKLSETKGSAKLVESLGHDISAYLFTITAINAGLGACIAVAMWWFEMPNPVLWGVMGFLFNFVPYLGALAGTAIVGVVALVTFSAPTEALIVPIVYFGLTALEGNVVTPMLIGRRFALNPVVVVVWFLAWGMIWGLAGMIIATPTLMAFKIVCANISDLSQIDRVISR